MPTWLHIALLTILTIATLGDAGTWWLTYRLMKRRQRMGLTPLQLDGVGIIISLVLIACWIFFGCYWIFG